jgi:hypothetical protein
MLVRTVHIAAILAVALLAAGCIVRMTLDDLKPAPAPPPIETISGNYAISITGARTRTVTVTARPGAGHEMTVIMPYGKVLAEKLASDIKAYAGGSRVIEGEDADPPLQPDDDGLIQVRMSSSSASGSMKMTVYTTMVSPDSASVTVRHSGEVIVRDKAGRMLRREVSTASTGSSKNWAVGMGTLVPGASRDAMEKSFSDFARRVVSEIVVMRRELAEQSGT